MAAYENLKVSLEGRVLIITVDRPRPSVLNLATLLELDSAMDEALSDDEVKVIVITGTGDKAFVVGADINELAEGNAAPDSDTAPHIIFTGQSLMSKIEGCPKPVIAAVNGDALGGGLELALACHLRVVAEHARLGQPEVKLGIIPGWGGTQRLPRLIGQARALELILTGEMLNASDAERLGLANRVVRGTELREEVLGLARRLAEKSSLTNRAVLRAVLDGSKMPPAEGLLHEAELFLSLMGTHDATEGFAAFREKRPPQFADR